MQKKNLSIVYLKKLNSTICASVIALLLSPITGFAFSAPVENRNEGADQQSYVQASPSSPVSATPYDQQPLVSVDTPLESNANSYNQPSAQPQQYTASNHADEASVLARLDRLEQEVRELRGQVELQAHTITQLKKQPAIPGAKGGYPNQTISQSTTNNHVTASTNAVAPAIQEQPLIDAEPTANSTSVQNNSLSEPVQNVEVKDAVLNEQKTYQDAYNLLINKQYSKAKPALQDYITQYPNGQFSVNAHYWLGEVSLLEGDTKSASKEFKFIINDHASSSKAPDAMLKLGFIYADEGKWQDARKQLTEIQKKYPNSAVAQLAEQRLKLMTTQGH